MLLASLAIAGCNGGDDHARTTPLTLVPATAAGAATTPAGSRDYRNPAWGIDLRFPSQWVADPHYRADFGEVPDTYESPGGRAAGFVKVDAANAPSLSYAVDSIAHHKLKPYGETPIIDQVSLPAGDGVLVLPDPASPQLTEAALAMPFPEALRAVAPIAAGYPYLLIFAQARDIRAIADSLRFLDPASAVLPDSPPRSSTATATP
ncbi:MAG TPA: hypothetical protein VFH62_07255 [Dehalococcoidia bacterium]|nr:hypothetical protein [Dehalococcoidia bacterium]